MRARPLQSDHQHIGREPGELVSPVEHERGGADHEHRAVQLPRIAQALHQGDHLQRLTETHLIGQNAAEAEGCQASQPAEALHLIGPQRVREGCGHLRSRRRPVQAAQVVFESAVAHGVAVFPIQIERLVGRQLGATVQQRVGRHAQVAHHIAEHRHIPFSQSGDAPVAQAMEALAAPIGGKHCPQLIGGKIALAHIHLNEVRAQGKTQRHPRRPFHDEAVERRSGEHLADGPKLRQAAIEQLAGQLGLAQGQRARAIEELRGHGHARILQVLIAEGLARGRPQLRLLSRIGRAFQHHFPLAVKGLRREADERSLLLTRHVEVEGERTSHRAQRLPRLGQIHRKRLLQHGQRAPAECLGIALSHKGRPTRVEFRIPQKRESARIGTCRPRSYAVGQHEGHFEPAHHQHLLGKTQVVTAFGGKELKRCSGDVLRDGPRRRSRSGSAAIASLKDERGALPHGIEHIGQLRLSQAHLALPGGGSERGAAEQALIGKHLGQRAGHGAGRPVEGLEPMGKGELLPVGEVLPTLHAMG